MTGTTLEQVINIARDLSPRPCVVCANGSKNKKRGRPKLGAVKTIRNAMKSDSEIHYAGSTSTMTSILGNGSLLTDDGEVVCDPKIDSGSENCIFERGLGSALGFEVKTGAPKRFSTVTGSFLTYGHDVTLSVLGIETATIVYFAADENFTRNVLGRQSWLDRVRLGLVDYEGKLYLSDYNESD